MYIYIYIYIIITEQTITSEAGLIMSGGLSADAGHSCVVVAAIAVSLLAVIALIIVIISIINCCVKYGENIVVIIFTI